MKTWLVVVSVAAVLLAASAGVGFWMLTGTQADLSDTKVELAETRAELAEIRANLEFLNEELEGIL